LKYHFKIFFIIISSIILLGCFRDDTEYKKAIKEESNVLPDQIAHNIEVVFFDSAHKKAILKAMQAEVYYSNSTTILNGDVRLEYFSKSSGKRLSILTADNASIDDKSKDMFAKGNVVVLSDSAKVTLSTTSLAWSNQKQIIYTNDYITIKTPTETINGYGFESNLDLSNYKIYKVSGIKQ
jgi:LPS export ABC transporter protein LptC